MSPELIAFIAAIAISGILATRLWVDRRKRSFLSWRLSRWADEPERQSLSLLKPADWSGSSQSALAIFAPQVNAVQALAIQAGFDGKLWQILSVSACAFTLPLLLAFALGLDLALAAVASAVCASLPLAYIASVAGARRRRFCEQLPDAIDLMVSVLRSGHSIPQAVKAIAEELPAPCGSEFDLVLDRMNLGQPLASALLLAAARFRSYELDLIRRAVSIQFEVGGSLAELLEKTNATLRQRLKLVRQVRVITVQSRLTALIVGLLPFALALALELLSPGYLRPLIEADNGRLILFSAVVLQAAGLVIMKNMSTIRV